MNSRNLIVIDEERVNEIRTNKKRCDWQNWKNDYSLLACLDFDDCKGCGAFKESES